MLLPYFTVTGNQIRSSSPRGIFIHPETLAPGADRPQEGRAALFMHTPRWSRKQGGRRRFRQPDSVSGQNSLCTFGAVGQGKCMPLIISPFLRIMLRFGLIFFISPQEFLHRMMTLYVSSHYKNRPGGPFVFFFFPFFFISCSAVIIFAFSDLRQTYFHRASMSLLRDFSTNNGKFRSFFWSLFGTKNLFSPQN